jgi:hypothetical protein
MNTRERGTESARAARRAARRLRSGSVRNPSSAGEVPSRARGPDAVYADRARAKREANGEGGCRTVAAKSRSSQSSAGGSDRARAPGGDVARATSARGGESGGGGGRRRRVGRGEEAIEWELESGMT